MRISREDGGDGTEAMLYVSSRKMSHWVLPRVEHGESQWALSGVEDGERWLALSKVVFTGVMTQEMKEIMLETGVMSLWGYPTVERETACRCLPWS